MCNESSSGPSFAQRTTGGRMVDLRSVQGVPA
jgi:hypothetical protein